ncbi:TLDc domain-containing protein [Entamoeba marina]
MSYSFIHQELTNIENMLAELNECHVLFGQLYHHVNQSVEKIHRELEVINNLPTEPLRNLLSNTDIHENVGRVIYEGFDDINKVKQSLCNRKNVLIIIGSEENVFGTFHSKTLGINEWSFDLEHFAFTIKNKFNVRPTKFKRKTKEKIMCITENELYKINGWGSIGDESYIDFIFPTHYKDTVGKGGDVFVGNVYLNSFEIDYFLALEMRCGEE